MACQCILTIFRCRLVIFSSLWNCKPFNFLA
uniref:Uncharacterized protein n=1 Tax=Rhizophora mucronata TaxID=61149 RepID=A0A2P2LTX9_RHIMU